MTKIQIFESNSQLKRFFTISKIKLFTMTKIQIFESNSQRFPVIVAPVEDYSR